MNLLLHRHFARVELGDHAAGFGAMLPDLVRMVDRTWRPRPERAEARPSDAQVASILDGIAHHVAIDAWFHRLPELRAGERRTGEAFRDAGATARRMPLLAHATFEMLLDGSLARRLGPDAVERELRGECDELASPAARAMALHGGGDAWSVPPADLARLWRAVPALASGYATAEGMARRLDGLRASFGLGRVGDDELARWQDALSALAPHADAALASIEAARSGPRLS